MSKNLKAIKNLKNKVPLVKIDKPHCLVTNQHQSFRPSHPNAQVFKLSRRKSSHQVSNYAKVDTATGLLIHRTGETKYLHRYYFKSRKCS